MDYPLLAMLAAPFATECNIDKLSHSVCPSPTIRLNPKIGTEIGYTKETI